MVLKIIYWNQKVIEIIREEEYLGSVYSNEY